MAYSPPLGQAGMKYILERISKILVALVNMAALVDISPLDTSNTSVYQPKPRKTELKDY